MNDSPVRLTPRYRYGAPGSGLEGLLTAIDHPGHREAFQYDQRNRITARHQVVDETTRLISTSGYDAVGKLIAQTDPLGAIGARHAFLPVLGTNPRTRTTKR